MEQSGPREYVTTSFGHLGSHHPPPIKRGWRLLGMHTKTTLDLQLPSSPDGVTRHRVWLAAAWIGYAMGPAGLEGPVCLPLPIWVNPDEGRYLPKCAA